jgi:hypothetical protein
MTTQNRKSRQPSSGSRQRLRVCVPEPVMPAASFHASLNNYALDRAVQRSPVDCILSLLRPNLKSLWQMSSSALTSARSWLQAKYAVTATKRLRISETVSLGEKRFVAIVKVEGREFLIGGGTAGMSLLAQLGSASESGERCLQQSGIEMGTK